MKRCLESYFNTIPQDVFHIIDDQVESIEQKNLAITCKAFAQYHFSKVNSLLLCIPENAPPIQADIYPGILERYPHIQKIEIDLSYYPYLIPFISYLITHPLPSLKKVKIYELEQENPIKGLNCALLQSIYHANLESIVIQTLSDNSSFSSDEIQPFLNQAINIREFKWIGNKKTVVNMSFHNQTNLISVKLNKLLCAPKTIESLRSLTSLQALKIKDCALTALSILTVLSKTKWGLKKLILPDLKIDTDNELNALTKQFPDLEEFDNVHPYLTSITSAGMKMIGTNCEKLKILRYADWSISNEDLDALTQPLSKLEALILTDGYTITEGGMAAIAKNCKNLHTLEMHHIRRINRTGIDALVQSGINLISFKIKGCTHFSLDDLRYLVQKMPKLKELDISDTKSITQEELELIKKEFPQFL